MKRFLAPLAALALAASLSAQEWKPAAGPLLTRWAKDVKPDRVLPEYPRPQMVRDKWMNLNGVWEFDAARTEKSPPVGAKLSGRILVPFPVESALSGYGKMVAGPVWYRRTFKVPADWKGERVLLHFGAVNWESIVWINQQEVGRHQGGYDAFSFDITEQLKDGDNEITVRAFNPVNDGPQPRGKQVKKPGGIYYTPSTGIWQTVWLEPVAKTSFSSLRVVADPDLQGVRLTFTIDGNHADMFAVWTVRAGGRVVERGAGAFPNRPYPIVVRDAKLWSPESPFLYELEISLTLRFKKVIDSVRSYFAFRKVEVAKDVAGITRLFLNGKPYFQVGPLDQGFWPDGLYTAPTDEALKYDIEVTKKLGFNMIRKHVKVEPARWYYWADKLGILVWQDMPSGETSVRVGQPDLVRSKESAAIYERELKAMIDGLRNHPSIVMWVPFNEGWGQYDTRRITEWVKKYDPTRLVNCASGWNDHPGVGDVHDIHVYPGPGSPQPEEKRAAVLGEFGGLGLPVLGHTWTDKKNWGYRNVKDSADLTRKYERLMQRVYELKDKPGLSAAVYTQTTDVETEVNGLLTYDRAVIKVDVERIAAVNRGDFSKLPKVTTVIPTAQDKAYVWRYTTAKPAGDWFKPDFDASAWKEGESGFGTKMTPGTTVRTEWKSPDIWIRREFVLRDQSFEHLHLMLHHDENAEVYINGILAAKVTGFTTAYEIEPISDEARKALKPGKNVIAIHCKQTGGGQYIDAGLVEVK